MQLYIHNTHHISTARLAGTGDEYELAPPDYNAYIDIRQMRRMSYLVKMGIFSAMSVLNGAEKFTGSMITGTGLGCIQDTFLFMKNLVEREEQMLSPTHFIQSTHNTLAGTAGIMLNDHQYNITWTQRFHTLFCCLEDAYLQQSVESEREILLILADEFTPEITAILSQMDCESKNTWTGGSAAFLISGKKRNSSDWKINDFNLIPASYLDLNHLSDDVPVYFGNSSSQNYRPGWKDLSKLTGINFIMDAIALSYCLQEENKEFVLIGGDEKFISVYHLQR